VIRPARAAWLAAGGAVLLAPGLVRAQAAQKVRLCGVPTDDLTPFFYAQRNGWYQRAGIDIEFVPTASGSAATAAVIAGAYELGKGSLIASLVAHLRGIPLTVVGNVSVWDPKTPFTLLLTAADSSLHGGADCNGKVAATAGLNDLAQLAANVWVDKNGGDSKSVKWVEVPNSAQAATLLEHRTDFGSLNEPQLSAALESGKLRVLGDGNSAISEHFVFGLFFAQPDWAAKHADLVKTFVRVTYEAAAYTNAHKAETAPMIAEITKIAPAIVQKMARVAGATSSDPNLIQPAIEVAAKYKYIPRSFPAKEIYFNG
jgi:NitT/TauT family transport system substrate-binding protein